MGAPLTPKALKGMLKFKFIAPEKPAHYIENAQLSSSLFIKDDWRICFITAATGQGKTSFMSELFAKCSEQDAVLPLWISLDKHDKQAANFSRAVAYLFQTIHKGFSELPTDFDSDIEPENLLIELVNLSDDFCTLDTNYFIFLDDYEQAESQEFNTIFLFLNRYLGPNFKFVISSSYIPPEVDDLFLDSPIIELRQEDIALNESQVRTLANTLMPELSNEDFEWLNARSGNWPLYFVFAAHAQKRSATSGTSWKKGLENYLIRFFQKEVLDKMSASYYEFLIETALLDTLDPPLCDSVTEGNQAAVILEWLTTHKFFTRYDAELGVYTYKPAFRSFLRHKLFSLRQSQIRKLASRASRWYSSKGMDNEAAKYLALACDPHFIEDTILNSIGLGRDDSFSHYLEYIMSSPAESFSTDPYLIWVSLWSFISTGLVKEARIWISLARASKTVEVQERAYEYAEAICEALEGDSKESLKIIRNILSEGGADLPHAFQCLLIHMEGEDCERLGYLEESRTHYLHALSLAERAEAPFYKMFDYYLLARQWVYLGNYEEAEKLVNRALSTCQEDSAIFGALHVVLALIYIERDDTQAAKQHLKRAQRRVSLSTNIDMYVDYKMALVLYERINGNTIEALEIATSLVREIDGLMVPRNMEIEAYALKASFAAELNELAILNSCEEDLDRFLDNPDSLRGINCMIAKARILWANEDPYACFKLLAKSRQRAITNDNHYALTRIHILECLYKTISDQEEQAMASLVKALELAMRGGYLTVFLEGGKPVQELIFMLITSRKNSPELRNYAKRVLTVFKNAPVNEGLSAVRNDDVEGYYSLTEREREILEMLNSGLSRREVAESFTISENTVKSHLKNIYSKLGVHTRAEAYKACQNLDEHDQENAID